MIGLVAGQTAHASDDERWRIGVGVAMLPRFEGSDEYRAIPAPLIDIHKGRFFARSGQGIGVNIVQDPAFTAGVAVNWMPGYRRKDMPDGIGKLSDALGGKLFASTHLAGTVFSVSATQAMTKSERGLLMEASLSYPYDVTERLKIVPGVSVSWANAKYMDSYFGVTAGQSNTSGLATYGASAGFKDVSTGLAASYELNERWNVTGAVGVSRLFGDAADSPLVKRRTQVQGGLGLVYSF